MDKKIIIPSVIISFILCAFTVPSFSMTVGVSDFNIHDTGLDAKQVSTLFESEVMRVKNIQVRNRKAIGSLIDYMSRCQTGLVNCGNAGPGLKQLDVIIFGDFHKHPEGYLLNVRAVSQKNWAVVYSGSMSGKKEDDLMKDLADEMGDKLRVAATSASPIGEDASQYKYRIAIYKIEIANKEAQKISAGPMLDSVLTSAFSKKGKFQIVERSRINDLLYEKKLAMSGLVQTDRAKFKARGITHYLTGSLKVYDGVRVLSYQIVNVNTGLPIISDIIEWTDDREVKDAMNEVAVQSEEQVFNVNGKLVIAKCDIQDVLVFQESKEAGGFPIEMGFCPITVEDIPAGEYNLIFKHDERDTLNMKVTIKPQETTRIEMVKMPPINMEMFYQASNMEGMGKYQAAIAKYKEFYEKYPKHKTGVYAMYRVGFITQIYLKKYDAGRKILEEVIKRKPDALTRTEAYYGIALGYQAAGNAGARNGVLKMLINEYPGSTAAEMAKICLDTGRCPQ